MPTYIFTDVRHEGRSQRDTHSWMMTAKKHQYTRVHNCLTRDSRWGLQRNQHGFLHIARRCLYVIDFSSGWIRAARNRGWRRMRRGAKPHTAFCAFIFFFVNLSEVSRAAELYRAHLWSASNCFSKIERGKMRSRIKRRGPENTAGRTGHETQQRTPET